MAWLQNYWSWQLQVTAVELAAGEFLTAILLNLASVELLQSMFCGKLALVDVAAVELLLSNCCSQNIDVAIGSVGSNGDPFGWRCCCHSESGGGCYCPSTAVNYAPSG